jgi:hypothetical protein
LSVAIWTAVFLPVWVFYLLSGDGFWSLPVWVIAGHSVLMTLSLGIGAAALVLCLGLRKHGPDPVLLGRHLIISGATLGVWAMVVKMAILTRIVSETGYDLFAYVSFIFKFPAAAAAGCSLALMIYYIWVGLLGLKRFCT